MRNSGHGGIFLCHILILMSSHRWGSVLARTVDMNIRKGSDGHSRLRHTVVLVVVIDGGRVFIVGCS